MEIDFTLYYMEYFNEKKIVEKWSNMVLKIINFLIFHF